MNRDQKRSKAVAKGDTLLEWSGSGWSVVTVPSCAASSPQLPVKQNHIGQISPTPQTNDHDMHRGLGDLLNGQRGAGRRAYHWRLRVVVGGAEANSQLIRLEISLHVKRQFRLGATIVH